MVDLKIKQNNNDLLTREEFKKQVFAKTNGKCCVPNCGCDAVDAHHIMDRRLFNDGGYYLSNGAALCAKHHLEAEKGQIKPMQCIKYMGIDLTDCRKPDKVDLDWHEYFELLTTDRLNKWGE